MHVITPTHTRLPALNHPSRCRREGIAAHLLPLQAYDQRLQHSLLSLWRELTALSLLERSDYSTLSPMLCGRPTPDEPKRLRDDRAKLASPYVFIFFPFIFRHECLSFSPFLFSITNVTSP